MSAHTPLPLDFLHRPPEDVGGTADAPGGDDLLPQATADELLQLPGVNGAWIEREASGTRVVVLHYIPPGRPDLLPREVLGMRVKLVGGGPIRAGG
jgi:hypothetical protein